MNETLVQLIKDFRDTLKIEWQPPADLLQAAGAAVSGCAAKPYDPMTRRRRLLGIINEKFRLNKDRFQAILDLSAVHRIFLNYHEKAELLGWLDQCEFQQLRDWLTSHGLPADLEALMGPITPEGTLEELAGQLETPRIRRSDARICQPSERRQEILRALFGSYIFRSFPAQAMHEFFNAESRAEYYSDFYSHLARFHPSVLHRDCALAFLVIDDALRSQTKEVTLNDHLCAFIQTVYNRLSNHCYLAILIKPLQEGDEDGQWRLFSDLTLYAEKHRESPLKIGYFHPKKIEQATLSHIPHLNREAARFDLVNEGFFYRDCFVLPGATSEEGVQTSTASYDILLMFEKNERDETLLPCPACRSRAIAGNSYPVLGVRSWECQNPICPERTAFDRGNRYSLAQLIKQQAIMSGNAQIPEPTLRKWKLDVVTDTSSADIVEMLLRHFTLHGDTVLFVNAPTVGIQQLGRRICYEKFASDGQAGLYDKFQDSALFHRFAIDRPAPYRRMHIKYPQVCQMSRWFKATALRYSPSSPVILWMEQ